MEVNIPSTTEDTDSPSSLVAEPSMSDSPDILLPNENVDADKKAEEERKLRRLERRKALALERSPMPPKLGGVLKSANNTIDLTTEDDDPTNQWFKKTFNIDNVDKKVKSPEEAKLFAVPRHVAKNAPRSIIYKEAMDKKLKASLAVKRRKAQEERRKMYEEDNEHLKEDTDEEEEEEVVIKKKKAKKPENEESDSDDEDYKPPGEEDHDDEMSVNLLNDSFTYDVFNNAKRSGPGSIVSNYSRSHDDLTDKNLLPTMSQLMGGGIVSNGGSEDILDFCSGKFEEFPDTLQMLLNEEKEKKGGDESEEEEEAVEEEEEEEEDPEEEEAPEEEEEDNAPEPNFDDEDDELAVLKRIEHQEYKKQIKKRTLFDDEASLSGDDVGSDIEDEEGVENAYEAEEGDADDVPDDDTIRRQNFKMLLKQENDKETRALAKLQEQLLADGDLGGVETNRQFRFKLREEVDTVIGMNIDGVEEVPEDDEPEEDEEKKKERAEMIKYRIEHAEELELLDQTHDNDDDDMFARAGKLLKKTEKITIEANEEISIKSKPSVKPSLLSKSALAVSFQEVLNGNNGAAPKQMYVQNYNSGGGGGGATSSGSKNPSRLSSGVKRALTSPDASEKAKRVRSSKLSSLE
ncbi:hypothetical protein CAEBREN_04646 [Caenorhabditis brenneri]|uniref:Uncharacterized protein n=1 Tax=Caenorhabditis brenneri TaxID=135651 RepID=G0PBA0_CAEBE|nr:hypothetical protein CAEBREN_04646 [Caenorhabditis brenneri]